MAILAIFTGTETIQMYEEFRKEVDWEHKPPVGAILHSVGFDNSGNIRMVEIWESEQDLKNFVNSILPVMERLNIPEPKGETIPIHNVIAFPAIDKHKV